MGSLTVEWPYRQVKLHCALFLQAARFCHFPSVHRRRNITCTLYYQYKYVSMKTFQYKYFLTHFGQLLITYKLDCFFLPSDRLEFLRYNKYNSTTSSHFGTVHVDRDTPMGDSGRAVYIRRERGQGNIHFPCSADHEQDWQPYPVDPYSCYTCDNTYIHNDRC